MTDRITVHGLQVATTLHRFIEAQVLPGTGIEATAFWQGFDAIVTDLAPKNAALLAERDRLQTELDAWHKKHPGPVKNPVKYQAFLTKIGYLVPAPPVVRATTKNVDAELALQAGPQLVVPITNARYALNAANARWGSLYDALYGTDAISDADGAERGSGYNPVRGAKVIAYARHVLDRTAPLRKGSHVDATGYVIDGGALVVTLSNGTTTSLAKPAQFIGHQGNAAAPTGVLLQHNGLHLDLRIDRSTAIGQTDAAGVSDLILESALSTILDLEDSVAVVDADDKVLAYGNWLGILKATLTEEVSKGGKSFTRGLNPDRVYTGAKGEAVKLHGRSLLFLRNVGHLMTNSAILWGDDGKEIPEGIMDAVITTTIALHDLQKHGNGSAGAASGAAGIVNSRTGSVYIVKPKMHGPAEVAFASELFGRVEQLLGLPKATVKLGIMDEERRTSANLKSGSPAPLVAMTISCGKASAAPCWSNGAKAESPTPDATGLLQSSRSASDKVSVGAALGMALTGREFGKQDFGTVCAPVMVGQARALTHHFAAVAIIGIAAFLQNQIEQRRAHRSRCFGRGGRELNC